MFLINVIEFLLMFEFAKYIFMAFAFFGVTVLVRYMIMGRGV